MRRFPKAQKSAAAAGFAEVQQGFVAGEILLGRRQSDIAELHALGYLADN